MKNYIYVLCVSLLCATITSVLIMKMAWDHNSQGEVHIDGCVDWFYLLLIGFSWFVPTFIFIITIQILGYFSVRLVLKFGRRRKVRGDA